MRLNKPANNKRGLWGNERGKATSQKTPYCRGECKAVYQAPAPHNIFGNCWLGTAPQFSHEMRGDSSGPCVIPWAFHEYFSFLEEI